MRGVIALRVASPALARGFCGPSYGRRLARGARRVIAKTLPPLRQPGPRRSGPAHRSGRTERHASGARVVASLQLVWHRRSDFAVRQTANRQVAVLQLDMPQRSNIVARGPGRPSREAVYERLDAAIAEVRDRLGGLPSPAEARAIWDELWVHEAHNSTAIEGNTLVLREVEQLLLEGRAVGDRQLAEYLEVKGYADAARWVYSQALEPSLEGLGELVTLTEVRQVHRMAMGPVWDVSPHPDATPDEAPGNFRTHDIRPFPGGMRPPSFALVKPRLRDWLDQVNAIPGATGHPMERLAEAHVGFEQVHPFLDGNGRTGRLLLNLILARLGYAPAIIQKRDRPRYLQALRRADAGNHGPLAELIARTVLDLSLIHISEPTRLGMISYAVFCLTK